MVWDFIVFFGGYTKVDQDHMSCNFASHQTKTSIPDLWVRDPVAMWKRPLLPRKLPPCVGDFRFAVKNYVRIILQPHKFEKNRSNKAYEESCPSDQLKNRKVFFHRYAYNRNGPCSVIPTGVCQTLWKGLNRASGKTVPSPKNTKTDNCKQREPKTRMLP